MTVAAAQDSRRGKEAGHDDSTSLRMGFRHACLRSGLRRCDHRLRAGRVAGAPQSPGTGRYAPALLLGPYLLAAGGVGLRGRHPDELRFARVAAAAVAVMGLLGALAVFVETAGVLIGSPAPQLPASGFAVAIGLLPQYGAGLALSSPASPAAESPRPRLRFAPPANSQAGLVVRSRILTSSRPPNPCIRRRPGYNRRTLPRDYSRFSRRPWSLPMGEEHFAPSDDAIREVAAAAVHPEQLGEEERAFLEKHALKKPLRVLDIWALGVGVVIAGAYFGWNLGLKGNGPVAMLVASLIVCLLYLTWVLALAELSVAMPFAGGPLAYGRRAGNPLLGFVMGWSMFLECQFAAIGTAMATGGYVAFLLDPANPSQEVQLAGGLATVALFFILQARGVKEQSRAMVLMTYGAILGLVIFCVVAATHFSWDRVWPPGESAAHGQGLEGGAGRGALRPLVAGDDRDGGPGRRGSPRAAPHHSARPDLAQITLIALVVLTWLFACGAWSPSRSPSVPTGKDINYPLAEVIRRIPAGQSPLLLYGFGVIALFGLIASYHGMIYGSSRQAFALGRAGYLPALPGRSPRHAAHAGALAAGVQPGHRGFVDRPLLEAGSDRGGGAGIHADGPGLVHPGDGVPVRRCGGANRACSRKYRTPVYRVLPILVIVLSLFCALFYLGIDNSDKVLIVTAVLYAAGLGYYFLWARRRLQAAAPEELAARHAELTKGART